MTNLEFHLQSHNEAVLYFIYDTFLWMHFLWSKARVGPVLVNNLKGTLINSWQTLDFTCKYRTKQLFLIYDTLSSFGPVLVNNLKGRLTVFN